MAPSPELGQPKPKAPDKVDTKQCSVDGTSNEMDIQKSSNATQQQDTENLGSWEDTDLKKLLDEAFTYKRPKDREHKSEIFRELLQNVEQEDKLHHISRGFLGRPVRGSNRHTQGGSLQDLVETVRQDQLLESDGLIGSHSRRQHNSRQKKYSSVSTRQREGGSLPSNVNCNPYEDHFSSDFGKRGIKNEKAILMSNTGVSRQDCLNRGEDSQQDGKLSHTVIEIGDGDVDETSHLLAHDSLAQDPHSSDDGTQMTQMMKLPRFPMNFTTHQFLNLEMMSDVSRIDKTVQFNSLKSGSKTTDMNAIQLNKSCVAVNSCIDSNSMSGLPLVPGQNTKFATYHHPHNIHLIEQKNTDENGNAVQSFNSTLPSGQLTKKDGKKKKTERNIKSTIAAKDIEGNRGDDTIEDLVSFIENDDTHKNGVINNNVSKRVLQLDKKGKKGDNKKENSGNNKLKKYNSMENLKSTSKLEEENAQSENGRESAVVLRHKQQMKKAAEMKESNKQQQHQKRSERHSWGTEELTCLGDTNSIAKEHSARENDVKEIRKAKDHQNKINKKNDEQPEPLVSSESILASNENAEFHVVTKKKKPKKKPEEIRPKPQLYHGQHSHMQGNRIRSQTSQNYSNDRDPYLNLKLKRRKSTSSSMPPSEKSDSSDVDSVHSLPIESSSRTNAPASTTTTGNNSPPASYAEIARISQQSKQSILATSLDKWPTVSNGKNPESPDNSNVSTCSTLSAKSQSSLRGNKFFPESSDMQNAVQDSVSYNNVTKAISYSQSLTDDKPQHRIADISSTNEDVIKRSPNSLEVDAVGKSPGDTNQKNPLQKSKSVDNDNYVNMNIDQYPALEKTVKPQKQYQSMPAVQINNMNANQMNVAISSTTKPSSKSTKLSSQSQSSPVVKSIESCTTQPSKKAKLTSTNVAHQPASKEKNQFDGEQEFVFNQIDDNLNTKQSAELGDVSFCTTLPPMPLHTSSTTKKSVKSSQQQNATQNHLNFERNRPAVIILDNNNKYGHNVSPLLFGDFNEDEVRQWDQDSEQPFIMPTNHHYDQTMPAQSSHIPSIQSNTTETSITNDKLLSPQSDLGYSSSYNSRNTAEFRCDFSTINSIASVDQTLDVASDQIQSNVRCSSSCSNSAGLDQVNNNNSELSLDNNSVNSNDVIIVKPSVQSGQDKISIVCEGVKLHFMPTVSNLDNYNHAKIVDFIGMAWEDIKDGRAEFYNGQ